MLTSDNAAKPPKRFDTPCTSSSCTLIVHLAWRESRSEPRIPFGARTTKTHEQQTDHEHVELREMVTVDDLLRRAEQERTDHRAEPAAVPPMIGIASADTA